MSKSNVGHDLSGLIRFAERAPWDEKLDDILALHLDPVCETTGLDPEAIFDAVGHQWEGTLWGCAFEDLMARDDDEQGSNLVDDYLKRRGWNEKAPNKAYMRALRQATMSLFEASPQALYAEQRFSGHNVNIGVRQRREGTGRGFRG